MAATTAGFARLRGDDSQVHVDGDVDFSQVVAELRSSFEEGRSKPLAWRKHQLQQVILMLQENHEEITAAILADHRGPKFRGMFELIALYQAAEEALTNLDEWTKDQKVSTPVQTSPTGLGKCWVRQEAKGVVLVIGPWNGPFECTLHPMIAAVAAGNCVVMKPSEIASASADVIDKLVTKYFDPACIRVVQGSVAETTALLREPWDHIFYTGNGHIGRIVLRAAAEHLTPVTLELGGKSPCIIDKTATMTSVVERIWAFKWSFNVGQVCVAPDYILIHKSREEEFIAAMKKKLVDAWGPDPKTNPSYARIINASHVNRIKGLLAGTQGEVVHGGLDTVDPDDNYFPPTIVRNAKLGEPLLTEEIFGPVLPVIAVDSIEEAVEKVKMVCPRPLALYVYTEDKKVKDYVLNNTLSGGVSINTSLEHLGNNNMPFGGVGSSGMGNYHGKSGFDTFTHKRSVLDQDTTLFKGSTIPDNPDDDMYYWGVKATVTGFLTEEQRRIWKLILQAGTVAVTAKLMMSRL